MEEEASKLITQKSQKEPRRRRSSIKYDEKIVTSNKIAYSIIGFYVGSAFFYDLPVMFFLKDELNSQPGIYSEINALSYLPWAVKTLFGFLTDGVPIFGTRRKGYLIINSLLSILLWLIFTFHNNSIKETNLLLFIFNIILAFTSVIADAVVVETSKEAAKGCDNPKESDYKSKDLISIYVIFLNLGFVFSACLKGFIIARLSHRACFFICAMLPLLVLIGTYFIKENFIIEEDIKKLESTSQHINSDKDISKAEDHENTNNNKNKNNNNLNEKGVATILSASKCEEACKSINIYDDEMSFCAFFCRKKVLIPLFFIIYYCAMPGFDDPMFYFLTIELNFTEETLGYIALISNIFSLLAVFIYRLFFRESNFKVIVIYCSLLSFFFSFLSYLMVIRVNQSIGLNDFFCCLFSQSFMSLLGQIVSLPILSLACMMCPAKMEGTVYSLFGSACNTGGMISTLETSYLVSYYKITNQDFTNLPKLINTTNIISLTPILLILLISDKYFETNECSENKED